MRTLDVKKILSQRGTKTYGFLEIAAKPDGSSIRIPYMIVVGKEEGPVLIADGCTHGDEYEGSEGITAAANELDPAALKGAFIGIPALNLDAFAAGNRVTTIDWTHQDANRAFPGKDNSYITNRVIYTYMNTFVKHANYAIAFHGGGNGLYLEPLAAYMPMDHKLGPITQEMAKAFGVQVLWRQNALPFGGVFPFAAADLGIPAILPEIGGQSTRYQLHDQNVEMCKNGLFNVMKYFKMLDGEVKYRNDYLDVQIEYFHTPEGGIHKIVKRPLEPCKKGDVLSYVQDIFGNKLCEITAPYDGIVIGYWAYPMIQPGNWTHLYGKLL